MAASNLLRLTERVSVGNSLPARDPHPPPARGVRFDPRATKNDDLSEELYTQSGNS